MLRVFIVIIISLSIGVFAFVYGRLEVARAVSIPLWSDVTSALVTPENVSDRQYEAWHQPNCESRQITVEDFSEQRSVTGCVVSSDHAELVVYEQQPGSQNALYALKRNNDDVFHRLTTYVRNPANLALLSDDTLLGASLENGLSGFKLSSVHENVTETPIQTGPTTFNIVYTLNIQAAHIFKDEHGREIPFRYIAASENGKYATAVALGRGIVRINLENNQVKLISNDVGGYKDTILAISDDGDSVAVIGDKLGPQKIYTSLSSCGSGDIAEVLTAERLCDFVNIKNGIEPILEVSRLFNPKITDTSFTVYTRNDTANLTRKLNFSPDQTSYRLDYLALGDSYSSGEGDIGEGDHYLPNTNRSFDSCHISSRSYPFILRDTWSLPQQNMQSIACSGARVVFDYYGISSAYEGQGGRLKNKNISQLKYDALREFIPGRVHQVEFVERYQPRVVTLTGGGNDVGFADILLYCATPYWENLVFTINSDCGQAVKGSILEQILFDSIHTQYNYNKLMIRALKEVSPRTKIVIVGYPSFITDQSTRPCALNSGALTRAEIQMMNRMVNEMNTMLAKLAHDTQAGFVDITDSLHGGRICEGSEYITGVWPYATGGSEEREMFHPNAKGHMRMAQVIANKYTFNSLITPPASNDMNITDAIAYMEELIEGGIGFLHELVAVHSKPGALAPNSQYTVRMYSEPITLGTFTTSHDGSIDAIFSLDKVKAGRHMLIIEGLAGDGTTKRLYQFIAVHVARDDVDGDGIKNKDDRCQFIEVWFDEHSGEDVCRRTSADIWHIGIVSPHGSAGALSVARNENDVENDTAEVTSPLAKSKMAYRTPEGEGPHENFPQHKHSQANSFDVSIGGLCAIIVLVIGCTMYVKAKSINQ